MKKHIWIYLIAFVVLAAKCDKNEDKETETSKKSTSANGDSLEAYSDTTLIFDHLEYLTKADKFRNYRNIERLDSVAAYIYQNFALYADTTYYQDYVVQGVTYRNVVCSFGMKNDSRTIVGAHYDVCGAQEGADDNASGVVGLLELARLLKDDTLQERVDLVAYTLEEPPFFRSEYMGSYIHAKSLSDTHANVTGMVCLEMIGYFDDAKGSQEYPVGGMKAIYGSSGDYIALVSQMNPGGFVKNFNKSFQKSNQIKTKEIAAPKGMTGIDFSDHLNYWHFGFKALMITDTAFYRNKNYHEKADTMEKLDLVRMAAVINAVYLALR